MKILAIETSHDDTSVVMYEDKKVLKEVTISQVSYFDKYGGTIPELASRLHEQNLGQILRDFSFEFNLNDIDYIAYTSTPGLIGSLQMGKLFAEALSLVLNKPIMPINHMHAHIYASCFEHEIIYPALALIVSGGHTQLWFLKSIKEINLVGETLDDAAGEAFDKIAKMLGLSLPGGPSIEKIAKNCQQSVDFTINYNNDLNFSFSGLKTKVKNYFENHQEVKKEIASGFQNEVVRQLILKTELAILKYKPNSIILGGGVAANDLLRKKFYGLHKQVLIPAKRFTTDNASMIAIMCDYLLQS